MQRSASLHSAISIGTNPSSSSTQCNGKQQIMQNFVQSFGEYKKQKTEELTTELIRHLQLLSVTIDYSTFDPNTNVAQNFYLGLHELLSRAEPQSTIAWCSVNVLRTSCKNSAARQSLINNYQFIMLLSQLLSDQLSLERKVKLLTLIQELSCGIVITWQMSYLPHLITVLTRWIMEELPEIVILSLSILVNICYKNLPAIYTLCRCTDVKALLRHCLQNLEGPKVEVPVCKLLIILDHMDGTVPVQLMKKLIDVLFTTILESFQTSDVLHMRHSLEFLMDFSKKHEDIVTILKDDGYNFDEIIEKTLNAFIPEPNAEGVTPDFPTPYYYFSDYDSECVAILLEFFNTLAEFELTSLVPHYGTLVYACLSWVQAEDVCNPALKLMQTIVEQQCCRIRSDSVDDGAGGESAHASQAILDSILGYGGLTLIVMPLREFLDNNGDADIPTPTVDQYMRYVAIMRMLQVLLGLESCREEVLEILHDLNLSKVLLNIAQVHAQSSSITKPESSKLCAQQSGSELDASDEAIDVYIHDLSLINELSKYRHNWQQAIMQHMRDKHIHYILARGLSSGSIQTKNTVLNLAQAPCFPVGEIAKLMTNRPSKESSMSETSIVNRIYPILSNRQSEKLDKLLEDLQDALRANGGVNASAAEIVDLYEYKLASVRESEQVAQASLDAAAEQFVQLQLQNNQLRVDHGRLQLVLATAEQQALSASSNTGALKSLAEQLSAKVEQEREQRLTLREDCEQQVARKNNEIRDLDLKLQAAENQKIVHQADYRKNMNELIDHMHKKDTKCAEMQKQLEQLGKNHQHEKANSEKLAKRISELEQDVALRKKDIEKSRTENHELQERMKIILKVVTK